jgi:maltose alpha-D-glucosyltransferase/alpha-amylase
MASRAPRSEAALERAVSSQLPALLARQRWFGDKGRTIRGVGLRDCAALGPRAWLVLVDVMFAEGPDETYAVPLVLDGADAPAGAFALTLDLDGVATRAGDAFDDREFCADLLAAFARDAVVPTLRGAVVRFGRTERCPPLEASLVPRRLRGEQSNTSVAYGDRLVLKALRRVQPGITLDVEVGAFLTHRARCPHVAPLAGAIEYVPAAGEVTTLGVLQGYVANQGDGWSWVLGHLQALPPDRVDELSGPVFRELSGLGGVTGALHGALASDPAEPDFAPEPITPADLSAWIERVDADVGRACEALRARLGDVPGELAGDARALLAGETALRARARELAALDGEGCVKIRVHGDYHLGQTLRTEGSFVVIDFEGEPARPLAERRRKQSVLVDIAGMLRSLDYAAHAALAPGRAPSPAGERWVRRARAAFLEGYRAELGRAPARLVPSAPAKFAQALAVFELDKALYEVRYELDHRPAWLAIPLRGLAWLLARGQAGS